MKISAFPRKLSAVLVICALGATASHAFAQGGGKAQAKGSPKIETHENYGRQAGELPHGLETFSEKKGELPSGLEKKRDGSCISSTANCLFNLNNGSGIRLFICFIPSSSLSSLKPRRKLM